MAFEQKLIYTAHDHKTIDKSEQVMLFVLGHGYVPLDPFTVLSPELLDKLGLGKPKRLELDMVLLSYSDELWVFGEEISEGVFMEIEWWLRNRNPTTIKYVTWEELETWKDCRICQQETSK